MTSPSWHSLQGDTLLDEIPHGVVVMDHDLRIVRHNHAFEEVFGPSRDKHCFEVYKDRREECPDCPARATFADGRQRVLEESGLDLHGQTVHYMAQLTPLRENGGDEVRHVAAITTDLTTTKRLQREYQTLFEKVPCYVTVLNRDRRVVKANEMFRRTFGEPRGEFCYKLFKHQHRECEDCPAARTFADGGSYTSQHVGTSRDGEPTHYVVSTAPLLWGDDEITHVIEMALDVTDVTRMEAELHSASAFRKALVENSLDAIVVTDEHERVVLMNRAAEELWSADRADLVGRKAPAEVLPQRLQQAADDETVLLHDTTITSLGGETIPVRLAGMNLHDGDRLLGGAVIAHDRREVKELEREKITAERLAAVGQTVAGLAHGIKNVLMGIDGGMYAFRSGMQKGDDARMLKGWQMLEENIDRISTFVREFLEFARGRKPEVKLVDPNRIVRKVVELFEDKAAMSGITLEAELQDQLPFALMDEAGIHDCLDNLVSNALDACEICDRPGRRVVMRTREDVGKLIIEVADNGTGIDYDIRKKVFTTFFSTKGANKGTGLGLLTTRKIVQQHGGKVSFESTAGEGSVFRLEFPRDRLPSLDEDESA